MASFAFSAPLKKNKRANAPSCLEAPYLWRKFQNKYKQYCSFFCHPKEIEIIEKVPDSVYIFFMTDINVWSLGQCSTTCTSLLDPTAVLGGLSSKTLDTYALKVSQILKKKESFSPQSKFPWNAVHTTLLEYVPQNIQYCSSWKKDASTTALNPPTISYKENI